MSACKIKIGDKFNRLEVVEKTEDRDKSGSIIWKCICDCNNETKCTSKDLKSGHKKSCGCLFTELNKIKIKHINDNNLKSNKLKLNIYEKFGDITYIVLQNGKKAIIDTEDVEKVNMFTWTMYSNGYCCNAITNTLIHRLLMNCSEKDKKLVVDHINHNKLDNRKENLRICTRQQNAFNMSKENRGVYFDISKNKWVAQISINGKNIHLGVFGKKEDALKVRKDAELEYFGEFANIKLKERVE